MQAYDGVLGRNADGDIIDALATDYERLEDGRVRFEIRDGVTFHNGDELQPSDIAYSVNRVVDPRSESRARKTTSSPASRAPRSSTAGSR